jgi:hypothetical protein
MMKSNMGLGRDRLSLTKWLTSIITLANPSPILYVTRIVSFKCDFCNKGIREVVTTQANSCILARKYSTMKDMKNMKNEA